MIYFKCMHVEEIKKTLVTWPRSVPHAVGADALGGGGERRLGDGRFFWRLGRRPRDFPRRLRGRCAAPRNTHGGINPRPALARRVKQRNARNA